MSVLIAVPPFKKHVKYQSSAVTLPKIHPLSISMPTTFLDMNEYFFLCFSSSAKIKNIISTEEAKAKLLAEQQNKKKDSETSFVPTNMAVNYVQHNRCKSRVSSPDPGVTLSSAEKKQSVGTECDAGEISSCICTSSCLIPFFGMLI